MKTCIPDYRPVLYSGILLILLAGIAPVSASAYIDVHTTPPGAWVCLDGWNCEYAPETFSVDPWTAHTLSAYLEGYQFETMTVHAPGEVSTLDMPIQLSPDSPETGSLSLQSSPSGADAWVDSRYYGTAPLTIGDLSPGTHSVLLRIGGYADHTADIQVRAGETTNYNGGLAPDPGAGTLQVASAPGGAAIYVDDNYQGMTPADGGATFIYDLEPDSYTLELLMPDYQTYTRTVTITNGITNDIHATLVPDTPGPSPDTTGQITARSAPSGASVYLDTQYKGATPLYLADIPAGDHTVLFRLSGYQDYTTTVNVAGGSATGVSGTLNPSSQPADIPTTQKSGISGLTVFAALGICCIVLAVRKAGK
jgi:hypothetical protein